MSKEYTYDIDKYTIGVDTNGEDGIGLTIAIIKNGEINFLGNCYGENARCLDLLIKENQDLKKQLEEYIKQNMKLKDELFDKRKEYQDTYKDVRIEIKEYKTQQKEFIKYLENEINKWNYNYDSYNYEYEVEEPTAEELLDVVLENYKKIMGDE